MVRTASATAIEERRRTPGRGREAYQGRSEPRHQRGGWRFMEMLVPPSHCCTRLLSEGARAAGHGTRDASLGPTGKMYVCLSCWEN